MAQKRYHPPIYWLGPTTWFPVEHCLVNNEPHKTVAAPQHDSAKCQESRVITCASFDTGNNQETAMLAVKHVLESRLGQPPRRVTLLIRSSDKGAVELGVALRHPWQFLRWWQGRQWFTRADWMVPLVIVLIAVMVWLVR